MLTPTRPLTVRFGTEGVDTHAMLYRGEYSTNPSTGQSEGWIELGFAGEEGQAITNRFRVEQLALIGNTLIILPTVAELKVSPLEQWLQNERRAQVQHLRELATDISQTSLRGILEAGITHNAHESHLAAALAREGWVKLEWRADKPGWQVHTVRGDFYVPESTVERVLGHPLPKKRVGG